jgi:hypothetical protein
MRYVLHVQMAWLFCMSTRGVLFVRSLPHTQTQTHQVLASILLLDSLGCWERIPERHMRQSAPAYLITYMGFCIC